MAFVKQFTFNAFQENTYVIYDDTKSCIIIDPGCYTRAEQQQLATFIRQHELTPVRLLLTHAHIDHVLGNQFVLDTYGLLPECHAGELPVLEAVTMVGDMYGIPTAPSPTPQRFIAAGETLTFGNTSLAAFYTPGHSPASLSYYCSADKFVIAGDVLFYGSIGRTDLPGGDFDTLLQSIRTQLLTLPDNTRVYCGHGPTTTIGYERVNNPFL